MNTPANQENFNESFIFYYSFVASISKIPDRDLRLQSYEMLFDYALLGVEPQLDDSDWAVNAIFNAIKPQIDANNKRRADGKKGGRKAAQPAQETLRPEPEAASQGVSTTPAKVTPEAKAATTEPDLTAIINQVASQIMATVQAAAQSQPEVQAEPAVQAQPLMQAKATVQAQPMVQAAPVMQVQPTVQATAGATVKPTPRAQTAQRDDALGPPDRIVCFGENQYPTTPAELGCFQEFAHRLFQQYEYGKKPDLADMERVLERTNTRVVRPDGEIIAVFDRGRADLLDYAFEQAKGAGKLSWPYVDGMYRNFLVRGIETGSEARQYDLERAHRNM